MLKACLIGAWAVACALLLTACDSANFNSASGKQSAERAKGRPDGKDPARGDDGGADSDQDVEADSGETLPPDRTKTPDGFGSDGFFDNPGGDFDNANHVNGSLEAIKTPRFAMLVNDLKCGMCHTKIFGDVASTSDVSDWSSPHASMSAESVSGGWFAAKSWTDKTPEGQLYKISVAQTVTQNYVGPMVPNEPGTQIPAFPRIDFVAATNRMSGTLSGVDGSGNPVQVDKIANDNVVVLGTPAAPILISGSVMIKGDLVIKGPYKGLGSIYVTGNIYIPGNLVATDSVFPYPQDNQAAALRGAELVKARRGDALGLATANSIFVADLDTKIYDIDLTPASQRRAVIGIDSVYNWFPGGRVGYEQLYESSLDCTTDAMAQLKSFNLIEAYLYAAKSIGGISRRGSWTINGGIITDVLHLLGTVTAVNQFPGCPATLSRVHKAAQNYNYINYDYRMSAGMRILGELAPYFN